MSSSFTDSFSPGFIAAVLLGGSQTEINVTLIEI